MNGEQMPSNPETNERPPEPVAENQQETATPPRDENEGRYDYDKASAVGHAMQESGFAGDQDVRWNENKARRDYATEKIEEYSKKIDDFNKGIGSTAEDKHELTAQTDESLDVREHQENFEHERQELKEWKKDLVDRAEELKQRGEMTFVELYDMNPEAFANMPASEFVEVAQEFTQLRINILQREMAARAHGYFLRDTDLYIQNRGTMKMSVEEYIDGHHADTLSSGSYGDDAFNLRNIRKWAIGSDPRIEDLARTMSGEGDGSENSFDKEQLKVVERVAELESPEYGFENSPRAKLEAYQDLVQEYWVLKTEEAVDEAKAKLKEFMSKYSPNPPAQEQPAA